ncbi:hypothetical protein AVEN_64827-1 [Araneus ventricosus]|uniref:Uncharacterized protein n=1 Tax=Araneus ventricosus TaxID=182803 RepID=A0A4Y2GJY0_ARAVE|nr:hypothetical protein AVEN_64827-1 [Araneus ventricosus]
MYPSSLLSANMCWTCGILTSDEWLASPTAQTLTTIRHRNHSEEIFTQDEWGSDSPYFHYPTFVPNRDSFAFVINQNTQIVTKGFQNVSIASWNLCPMLF